jgi:hypothetical protein
MRLKRLIGFIILALGVVEVGLVVGLATLLGVVVLIWRVWVVEEAIHERVDVLDSSLAAVVNVMLEKIDAIGGRMPEINLINENPIGQLFDFLRGNAPENSNFKAKDAPDPFHLSPEGANSGYQPPKDSTGQFVEVKAEPNGTQKE